MTKAEFVDASKASILILSTSTGLVGGFVRLLELAKETEFSKVALDPWLWLCAIATFLPVYLINRMKFNNGKIVDTKQTSSADGRPERHVVEKYNFEVTPLGINMGDNANPDVSSEKPKIGTAKEDDGPGLMDTAINMAVFGTTVPIIRFSKTKRK